MAFLWRLINRLRRWREECAARRSTGFGFALNRKAIGRALDDLAADSGTEAGRD